MNNANYHAHKKHFRFEKPAIFVMVYGSMKTKTVSWVENNLQQPILGAVSLCFRAMGESAMISRTCFIQIYIVKWAVSNMKTAHDLPQIAWRCCHVWTSLARSVLTTSINLDITKGQPILYECAVYSCSYGLQATSLCAPNFAFERSSNTRPLDCFEGTCNWNL